MQLDQFSLITFLGALLNWGAESFPQWLLTGWFIPVQDASLNLSIHTDEQILDI